MLYQTLDSTTDHIINKHGPYIYGQLKQIAHLITLSLCMSRNFQKFKLSIKELNDLFHEQRNTIRHLNMLKLKAEIRYYTEWY